VSVVRLEDLAPRPQLELRRRLHAGEGTQVIQALYRLGGVGKTQLALEYAH
jgi:hypothetical protein